MSNMYDFKDKKTIDQYYSWRRMDFANKDYVPFSSMFNLNDENYYTSSMRKGLEKYLDKEKRYQTKTIKMIEQKLKDWINEIPTQMPFFRSYRESISKFYSTLTTSLQFKSLSFRANSYSYVRGYYTLIFDNVVFESRCFFMLVIKREYVKYVKLCILLEEPIMEDCYEFWYDEKAIEKHPENVRLKKLLNKMLKELNSIDLPCIPKENILDLFKVHFDFKAPTILAQKEKINQFVEEYQKEEISLLLGGKTS
jgi:hypothetical protein